MSQPGLCYHHDERIAALDAAQARWLTRSPLERARADFEAAEAWAEEAWVDALGALTAWRRLRQGRFHLSPASRTRLQLQARAKLQLARALRAERDRKAAFFQRLGSSAIALGQNSFTAGILTTFLLTSPPCGGISAFPFNFFGQLLSLECA